MISILTQLSLQHLVIILIAIPGATVVSLPLSLSYIIYTVCKTVNNTYCQ